MNARPAVDSGPTIDGRPLSPAADMPRMRSERFAKLLAEMERQDVDGVVLFGSGAVSYATGALTPGSDSSQALLGGPVAVVAPGYPAAHLLTDYPEGVAGDLESELIQPGIGSDLDEGAAMLASVLADFFPAGSRVAFDDVPHPLRRRLTDREILPASSILGPARLCKTVDELACIRTAQAINEAAMVEVYDLLRPGVRQNQLSALFLRRVFELGATANCIDPIWQPMPATLEAGPWTTHGGVAFPLASTDAFLRDGDVVWVDSGISFHGYASDFGRTWIVGLDPQPTKRQQAAYERWTDVTRAVLERCRPGTSALGLGRAATDANGGIKPWIDHFYLAHGVGTESAEMPLIGTDLGEDFDAGLVLRPGMVLVLEPVIWDDGAAGFRAEDIFVVTDAGWAPLSDHPFDPFGRS
jgi:Xaa-Pro dipeptidase